MFTVAGPITLIEPLSGNTSLLIKINAIYAAEKSKYQEILIVETEDYGPALVLDGFIQSTYKDEAYYHEALVQPAMVTHPSPQDVLILGGGGRGRRSARYLNTTQ